MRLSFLLLAIAGCQFIDEQLTDEICRYEIDIDEASGGVDFVQLNPDDVCKMEGVLPDGLRYQILLGADESPVTGDACNFESVRDSYVVRDLEFGGFDLVPYEVPSPGRVSVEVPEEFVDGTWFRVGYVSFDGVNATELPDWSGIFQLGSPNSTRICDDG